MGGGGGGGVKNDPTGVELSTCQWFDYCRGYLVRFPLAEQNAEC